MCCQVYWPCKQIPKRKKGLKDNVRTESDGGGPGRGRESSTAPLPIRRGRLDRRLQRPSRLLRPRRAESHDPPPPSGGAHVLPPKQRTDAGTTARRRDPDGERDGEICLTRSNLRSTSRKRSRSPSPIGGRKPATPATTSATRAQTTSSCSLSRSWPKRSRRSAWARASSSSRRRR